MNRYIDNSYAKKRKFERIIAVLLLVLAIFIIVGLFSCYNTEKEYTVTITKMGIKNYNNTSKYLIWTVDDNGQESVYEITDTILRFRFDSSDFYGKLHEGSKYKLKTIGFRFPFFSWYENIISAEQIDTGG